MQPITTKLLALLLALLTLAACSDRAEPSGSTEPPSQQTSSSEEPATEEPSGTAEDEIVRQQVSESIAGLGAENFASAEVLSRLADMGIDVRFEQIKEIDERHISFELAMNTPAGQTLRLPLEATCFYGLFDPEVFDGQIVGNFRIEWGGISVVDDATIALSTFDAIQFYDAGTLASTGLVLNLSELGGTEYYLLGAKRDDKLGMVVPIFFDDQDGFAFFNEDGTLRETQTFEYGRPGKRWFFSTVNADSTNEYVVYYMDTFDILNLDAPYLVFGDCYYNVETKSVTQAFDEIDASDGNRHVELKNFNMGFGNFPGVTGDKSRLALYYEDEEFQSGFFFNGDEISPSFGRPNKEEYLGLSHQWDVEKPILSTSCPFSDLTVTLDFDAQAASLEYNIDPVHLEDSFAISPDGRYSLHNASSDGGGDISLSNIVLKDNASGTLRFITLSGGMYGGNGDIGFLSNGDIYTMSLDSLRILSTDPAAPAPLSPFLLPLGLIDDNGTTRRLHTFRRDPATMEYIVLYSEEPSGYEWDRSELPFTADFNYIVGFCDQEGNLLESYDTGAPVLSDPFGLNEVSFKLVGDQLEIISTNGKGYESGRGMFDLNTHSYTEITGEGSE
jgi:hypothetical protein